MLISGMPSKLPPKTQFKKNLRDDDQKYTLYLAQAFIEQTKFKPLLKIVFQKTKLQTDYQLLVAPFDKIKAI